MKFLQITIVTILFIFLLGCESEPKPGEQVLVETGFKVMDSYWLYLPRNYDPSKKWPVILFLTGGYGVSSNPQTAKEEGPAKFAVAKLKSEELSKFVKDTFIIINPHMTPGAYEKRQWFQFDAEISKILSDISDSYSVDENRFYLTGLSRGGIGSWEVYKKMPQKFAALVTIAGPITCNKSCDKIVGKPIWIIHNEGDNQVSVDHPREVLDEFESDFGVMFEKANTVNFTGDKYLDKRNLYSEIKREGHDAWNSSYASAQLYKWMLNHKLN